MQTTTNGRTILVGEDEPEVRGYLEMALKCLGYSVELAGDGNEVLRCLQSSSIGISAVLLDIMMPHQDGMATLREIRRMDANMPVIMVSGASSTLNVVTAMKGGATDFLCKPVTHEDLRKAVNKAVEIKADLKDAECVPPSRLSHVKTKGLIGLNPRMKEIQAVVAQIGWSEVPILIQGETGSGKEVLARELHAHSPRANKPFLKLNCAALPSELVESELFGYERGAFTGAIQKKVGMFELADGGTMLLDEIGDMDVRLQAKLLQVLQDYEFQRIGGKEVIRVNVRIMAATHCDLEQAIVERNFREDLYYRLNVINLQLPPLRERKEDIIPLAEFLLKKHAIPGVPSPPITLDLKQVLMSYQWPGNVRELENVIRKLTIMGNPEIVVRDLQAKMTRKPVPAAPVYGNAVASSVERTDGAPILERVTKAKHQAETEAILVALNATNWKRKQAATLLKIGYKVLLYKMKKLGVEDNVVSFSSNSGEHSAKTLSAVGD